MTTNIDAFAARLLQATTTDNPMVYSVLLDPPECDVTALLGAAAAFTRAAGVFFDALASLGEEAAAAGAALVEAIGQFAGSAAQADLEAAYADEAEEEADGFNPLADPFIIALAEAAGVTPEELLEETIAAGHTFGADCPACARHDEEE